MRPQPKAAIREDGRLERMVRESVIDVGKMSYDGSLPRVTEILSAEPTPKALDGSNARWPAILNTFSVKEP
jgi:hypothetical protein